MTVLVETQTDAQGRDQKISDLEETVFVNAVDSRSIVET